MDNFLGWKVPREIGCAIIAVAVFFAFWFILGLWA